MEELTDILLKFCTEHSLWERAKQAGIVSIDKYLKEDVAEADRLFPELTIENFNFRRRSQQLTFWNHLTKTFVVSTKYDLFIGNQDQQTSPVGYYTLNVDSKGNAIDDWLVFN